MSREYPCVYYDNQKCTLHNEPGYTDWCVLGPCSHETPSRADRIRAMSDEEMAKWLCEITTCECCRWAKWTGCEVREWLKQPYKEDT